MKEQVINSDVLKLVSKKGRIRLVLIKGAGATIQRMDKISRIKQGQENLEDEKIFSPEIKSPEDLEKIIKNQEGKEIRLIATKNNNFHYQISSF